MKEKISVEFGLTKEGNNLFYVSVGSDRCFWIEEKEAKQELDIDVLKSLLEPTSEGLEYIKSMYSKWYKEYVNG